MPIRFPAVAVCPAPALPPDRQKRRRGAPALRPELEADFESLSNAGVDQRNQGVDRLRRNGAGAGVEVEAGILYLAVITHCRTGMKPCR